MTPKIDPFPINIGSDQVKYQRIPSLESNDIDFVLEDKKQRKIYIYRYKLVSNFFRFLYFITSLLIIFSPHVWNNDSSFSIKDKHFKIGLFAVVGSCVFINLLNCCFHYFLISVFLVIIDINKFIMCAKINYIEKHVHHKNYDDSLNKFGYILCIIFIIIDLFLVFTTYKIHDFYVRPRY
uniref:Uncharacterized protein n=1 Tax=viral metagenome TaxID=1070528 RepID=A0A6C0AC59_9ZZZZ